MPINLTVKQIFSYFQLTLLPGPNSELTKFSYTLIINGTCNPGSHCPKSWKNPYRNYFTRDLEVLLFLIA